MTDERHNIRIDVARAVRRGTPEEARTTVYIGQQPGHQERPKVHSMPCEGASVVWYDFLGDVEHKAFDCSLGDGWLKAAELITEEIDGITDQNPEETVPVKFDAPDEDADEIADRIDIRENFYVIER